MYRSKKIALLVAFCSIIIIACKKDKSPKIILPELTTAAITSITANTAMGGGTISSNGGETITASGVCWSITNQNPTISDDSTKGNTANGNFISMLTNLAPSSNYYVRAYATNRNGTGYGNVVTFNTGNGAPVASDVNITGTPKGNELLTGNYTYSDPENDTESGSTFQWYVANDASGAGETLIDGATEKTFKVQDEYEGKYIRFGVTPKAAAGNQNGTEIKSTFVGAVGEATTVTFMYDGAEVTYGILNGATGKKWMDRNLGATRAPTGVNDYQAYGDMFQWGRLADGHQRVTRTGGTDEDVSPVVAGVSTTRSAEDVPPSNQFITTTSLRGDWRNPQNSDLWQGANGTNNPCPTGWRVPTQAEWIAEGFTNITDAYTKLKITYSGVRDLVDGTFKSTTEVGYYWSSTIAQNEAGTIFYSIQIGLNSESFTTASNNRGNGYPCRCIKE